MLSLKSRAIIQIRKSMRWSYSVADYYPVKPRSRWRPDSPPHDLLTRVIERNRADYEALIDVMDANLTLLQGIGQDRIHPNAPYWNNPWFTGLDAAALVSFIAWKRPSRYLEIGSGNSTRFARYTIDALRLATTLTSVDPEPREEIDRLCTRTIRAPLEDCDLRIFDELESGDIVFFDGSHRVFTNSDVVVFFFEVMPRLKSGVIVHIHDIFIPDDYPGEWDTRLYSEQYLLAAMLMGDPPFRVIAPNAFIGRDRALGGRVRNVFASLTGDAIPSGYPDGAWAGASFWIEMRPSVH